MKILLTNDDGIDGAGLWAMARALKNFDVVIAAPMSQQSGVAHAMTIHRKMEYRRVENPTCEAWAIDGTPTDCVKFYLEALASEKFGAVISGINDGANLATDVLYSGTVGGALEGFLHDIPALAVSRDIRSEISFDEVAEVTAKYFTEQLARGEVFFHNVNFPKRYRAGSAEFKFARLGRRDYVNAFIRHEIDGKHYFEIRGDIVDLDRSEGTDISAVESGYVSVTPLHIDVTHYEKISAD
ncbi:MAG: 5'/3'-nucleotidase SurE [Selenomonadaceae bacterium]|nr:5'/3'-nucleotidase SurE [Selenomonadaceae bacterium]